MKHVALVAVAAAVLAAFGSTLGEAPTIASAASASKPASLASVSFGDATHGWAVGGTSIVATSNGGATWADQLAPAAVTTLTRVAASDSAHAWAVGTSGDASTPQPVLIATVDGGATWTAQTIPAGVGVLVGIAFTDLNHGWAVGSHPSGTGVQADLIATKDGGTTWVRQTVPGGAGALDDVSFLDSQHGFASGGGLLRTSDGGQTWSTTNAPQPIYGHEFTRVQFIDASHGWVTAPQLLYCGVACAGMGGSSSWTELYGTTDGGATWSTEHPFYSRASGFSFIDASNGWVVGDAISVTHDGGKTWATQPRPVSALTSAVAALTTSTAFVVGANTVTAGGAPSALLRTTDGGTTWTDYPDSLWVSQLYQDELGRAADTGGLAYWMSTVSSGQALMTVPVAFTGTPEFRNAQIAVLYQSLLRRPADGGGQQTFAGQIATGTTYEQVTASLLGSQEYFANRGGGTNDGWLNQVYSDILGRPGDSTSRSYWASQLAKRSRVSVAYSIVTTTEALEDRVNMMYQRYLRRAGDGGGMAFWASLIQKGRRDETIVSFLTSSAEYYAAAATY